MIYGTFEFGGNLKRIQNLGFVFEGFDIGFRYF